MFKDNVVHGSVKLPNAILGVTWTKFREIPRLRIVSNFGDSGEILSSREPIFARARVYFAGIAKVRDYSQSTKSP